MAIQGSNVFGHEIDKQGAICEKTRGGHVLKRRGVCLREVHYFSIHAHLGVEYPAYIMATYESIKI